MSTQKDSIYILYRMDSDKEDVFYVGITDDFDRRCGEHQINFNEYYVEPARAGQLKTDKYYKASQLAEYKYARSVCKDVSEMLMDVICEDTTENSKYTEAFFAVKFLRAGHILHQDESKLLRWKRMAADKSYKNKSKWDAKNWKEPVEKDETDLVIDEIRTKRECANELFKKLTSAGWRNNKRVIDGMEFRRWNDGSKWMELVDGTARGGKTYKQAAYQLAEAVAWAIFELRKDNETA